MKHAALPILTLALVAGCATAPGVDGSQALVGQPLRTAVEAIGYLPDIREDAGHGKVYVWQLGHRRGASRTADARNTGSAMHATCSVHVTTDADNVIRAIDLEESYGGCAPVNRKLLFAAS